MIENERVIAVIPARGGSKSVPYKNIRPLAGTPLIGWSIQAAKKSKFVDRVIVSTDDSQIAEIALSLGAEVKMRPAELAQDHSKVIDAVKHLITKLRSEGEQASVMVLLEPTCPFRSSHDIDACLEMLSGDVETVATFTEAKVNPHRTWRIHGDRAEAFINGTDPWAPRQLTPEAFQLNGGVYAFKVNAILTSHGPFLTDRSAAVKMPPARSVDIDDEMDFLMAEAWVQKYGKNSDHWSK
jgi:CMP-N,N'-diacetyllegionaminic acid synthase